MNGFQPGRPASTGSRTKSSSSHKRGRRLKVRKDAEDAFFEKAEKEIARLQKKVRNLEKRIKEPNFPQTPLTARTADSLTMSGYADDIETLRHLIDEATLAKLEAAECGAEARPEVQDEMAQLVDMLDEANAERDELRDAVASLREELKEEKAKFRDLKRKADSEKTIFAAMLQDERSNYKKKLHELRLKKKPRTSRKPQ